jgi:glycosyltransferase involved in cell wall biosynthesis
MRIADRRAPDAGERGTTSALSNNTDVVGQAAPRALLLKVCPDEQFLRTAEAVRRRFPAATVTALLHEETYTSLAPQLASAGISEFLRLQSPRGVRLSRRHPECLSLLDRQCFDIAAVPVAGPTLAGYENVCELLEWLAIPKVLYYHDTGRVLTERRSSPGVASREPAPVPVTPVRSRPRTQLGWASPLLYCDGYGQAAQSFMIALGRMGIAIRHIGIRYVHRDGLQKEMLALLDGPTRVDAAHRVLFYTPDSYARHRGVRNVGFTMFETTEIPSGWERQINRYVERLMVPTPWNREVFARCGVRVPIDVVPLGIDGAEWPLVERAPDRPFTFLVSGVLHRRKGADVAIEAFRLAFPRETDVRLLLKTRDGVWDSSLVPDERTVVIDRRLSHGELLELMGQVDCFVFPTRGEGFGLPPLEALATGCSVIVTNGGATGDILNPDYMLGIEVEKWVPCAYGRTGEDHPGLWMEPSVESCARQMRHVYEHRQEEAARARCGAEWVKAAYSSAAAAAALVAPLEQVGFFG